MFAHLTGQHDISTPEGKSLVMGELRELTELLPKQGSFRYLLTQSFREKLGLGKRFTHKSATMPRSHLISIQKMKTLRLQF